MMDKQTLGQLSQYKDTRYQPHNAQREFHESGARFRLLRTGRRFGKTLAGAHETYMIARSNTDKEILITAPVYKNFEEFIIPSLQKMIPKHWITSINHSNMIITLKNDCRIFMRSTEKYEHIRGIGPVFVWMDEAAQTPKKAWDEVIRPALMDNRGEVIFTTTPRPMNWLQDLFERKKDNDDYCQLHFGSKDNPYLTEEELKDISEDMPEDVIKQEILGIWLDDSGAVFKNIMNCAVGFPEKPRHGDRYTLGCDLGKHQDWTVIYARRHRDNNIVYSNRWQKEDWETTIERVANICKQYNNGILELDATGIGDVVLDLLKKHKVRINPTKFDNKTKVNMIQNLQRCIEQRLITFPEIPELINELRLFTYKTSDTGITKYSAPEGYHDDCVIALGLACIDISTKRPGKLTATQTKTEKGKVTSGMTRRQRAKLEERRRRGPW